MFSASAIRSPPFRLIDVRRHEWPAVIASALFFFCLLSAYYVLRPVRDEMGIQAGIRNLPWLFTGTFVGMLITVPIFGWAATRFSRRILVPAVYYFAIGNLLLFYVAMVSRIDPAATAKGFFVWLSVFNYFAVSVFWMLMADIFRSQDAKRLFALFAAGGSLGALAGPLVTAALVTTTGIPALLLISAGLLFVACGAIHYLTHWARRGPQASEDAALGGSILAGVRLVWRNPYLLAIAGYILLLQILGTVFYLEQIKLVAEQIPSPSERTQLFAALDAAVNGLTLLLEVFVTSALVRRVGLVTCLCLLPILAAVSLAAIGLMPVLAVVAVGTVLRRATEFAIAKPAREMLYTVVSREERYKAKQVIDTVVQRGGDVVAAWGHADLRGMGLSTAQMAFAAIPFALTMIAAGIYLGRRHAEREAMAGEPRPA
jgi:AAA family ATP:ADP antiporter